MNYQLEIIGKTGLQFFGKMSASISHEIKNTLAIINENAGLLKDFVSMAEQGVPLDHDRLKTLAGAVQKQIGRADGIVKNLNQFAHSVDETITRVDLNDILGLVVALSVRFAATRNVNLESRLSAEPVMLQTIPFFLMNLIWLCLEYIMDAAGSGTSVELVTEKAEDGACIRFIPLASLLSASTDIFPTEREKTLLGMLNADFSADTEFKEFILKLPEDIHLSMDE
jgi:signal transduction histidine kinase